MDIVSVSILIVLRLQSYARYYVVPACRVLFPVRLQSRMHKVMSMHYFLEAVCIIYHYLYDFRYLSRATAETHVCNQRYKSNK